MPRFAPVNSRAQFAKGEHEILDFWRREKIFDKSLQQRKGAKPYVFYEGPPTANGKPGIHHVLARSFKDLFPRYKQMNGFSVERKAGWDTHGLPVELEVEKRLKISGKKQIEEYGVEKFNALCKESVADYIDEWETMTERLGFWLDMGNPYRTYDSSYIESVWWSLKNLWDRGLLYLGYKVAPYCPRCQTSLSSHELSQGYREDTSDPSVYVKFKLADSDGTTSLLAWTTTPWTLPGNVGVAVHPDEAYVTVEQDGEKLILAKARLGVLDGEYEILDEYPGKELVDYTYEPLFTDMLPDGKAFVVLSAPELVSMDDGTGIVHTAAAYGEADLLLCQREGVAVRHVVGLDGKFLDGQTKYRGIFVKDADPQIIDDLQSAGRLYKSDRIKHTYPFCWRCETPLIYYALNSWFIRTTAVKKELLHNNKDVNWQPPHIRDGRMGNWLENLVDWNLSRSRYWGTPLPIWECDKCDHRICVGSAAEIGLTLNDDLHKPFIDEVHVTCEKCKSSMTRVADVIDCWYDSGAMPFAQHHYPFENKEYFEGRHPADFICEAIDQTRGWFFSLLALSTLIFGSPAYKNVICLGHVVDKSGKKMSKSRGNIIEPMAIFEEFGADSVRWYFYSAISAGEQYRTSRDNIQDVVRRFMLTLWNTYSFFVTYAEIDGFDPDGEVPDVVTRPALDRWCLARLAQTLDNVRVSLDGYDATTATRQIEAFIEDLSKWYVRRSRRRFWKSAAGEDGDKQSAYATLFTALDSVVRMIAPFMPFISERMYRNLNGFEGDRPRQQPESVHLSEYPHTVGAWRDSELLGEMARVRRIVEEGLAAREAARIKVKQPLAKATVTGPSMDPELISIAAEELNVKQIVFSDGDTKAPTVQLDTVITDELRQEGLVRELSRTVNDLRKKADLALDDRIVLHIDANGDLRKAVERFDSHLRGETLAREIKWERSDVLASWEGKVGDTECWLGVAR